MRKIEEYLDKVICSDAVEVLKQIPSNSIDLVITSPPYYNQRDYGRMGIGNEKSVEKYIDNLMVIFKECVRVVKDTGSIVFNIGDKYKNGNLLLIPYKFAIEVLNKNPVKVVNDITWVKLNPTPRQFRRRLVSATEPFFHFVKSDNYYYNMDAFMNHLDRIKNNNNRVYNNIGKRYFELIKQSSLSEKEKKMAREELQNVIEEVKSGKIASFRMKIRGIHSLPFGGQEGGRKIQLMKKGFTIIRIHGKALKRDVIECAVETIKGCKHPAIYPEYIIMELLKLLTRKGDIVLDPFMGSGTTAVACRKLGRRYIGCEINPEYCKYTKERFHKI